MIKKLFFIALLLIFSQESIAQNSLEDKANEITKEMARALSLSDAQKEKVFMIHYERFKEANTIRENYGDEPQIKKAALKKVYNKLYGKLQATLGKELMNKWKDHKKNK